MLKHLQSYIVHYAAMIAGLCAVVAKLNPALLGPYSGFIGAAAAGVAIANALGIKPETAAKVAILVLFAMPLTVLSGCSTVQKVMSNPASASAVQAAIDLAVGTTITQTAKTPAAQANEASQITLIATSLEGVLTGDSATLAGLDQVVEAKIAAAKLPPPQQAAAAVLVQTVQAVLLQQIQSAQSKLKATDVVAVKTVLDDVIQAASFYGVHARAVIRAAMASARRRQPYYLWALYGRWNAELDRQYARRAPPLRGLLART